LKSFNLVGGKIVKKVIDKIESIENVNIMWYYISIKNA
jgi:hypothetical protein